jgi:hypothetical protein
MIHLDGPRLAATRGGMAGAVIERQALRIAAGLHGGWVPPAVENLAAMIPGCVAKAERDGDVTVEDTIGRLISAALRCTPADLGRNPPELPDARGTSPEELRVLQDDRLRAAIVQHNAARLKRRAHRDRRQRALSRRRG